MSDKIFDKLMSKEDELMDKTYDLIRILLQGKKMRNDIHIRAKEIDDILFDRHELSCSYSTVSDMEKKEK